MRAFLCCAALFGSVALIAGFGRALPAQTAKDAPEVKTLSIKIKDESGTAIDVVGIPGTELEVLRKQKMTPEQWTALFAVFVDHGEEAIRKDQTAMIGTYSVEKDVLRFEPRFPLARGVHYRAVFDGTRMPGRDASKEKPIETKLFIPKLKTTPTVIENIYPTRDDLPENQLKFYLHFSAPMSRGTAYEHIHLLDAKGKVVAGAFLELGQELWDPDLKRFTLLIDPGRIKQGLKPREDLGPVLEKGKTYTLVIDRKWCDGNDEPLKETFKKSFRVVDPEEKQPDPKKWVLDAPAANSTKPLTIKLGKSLDHALLESKVWVEDDKGRRVLATVEIADKETVLRLQPKEAWNAGTYQLVVDKRLEDLAGNNVERPFEVDGGGPIERADKSETMKIPFVVK